MECGLVGDRELVCSCGQASPLLETVDAPLDVFRCLYASRVCMPRGRSRADGHRSGLAAGGGQPGRTAAGWPHGWPDAAGGRGCHVRSTRGRPERPGAGSGACPGLLRGTRMRDITVSKAGASPDWPAVTVKARGRARPSAARWILVLSPPRERPSAWSAGSPGRAAPFACSGSVLMGPHDRGVHRHRPVEVVSGVRRSQDGGEDHLPGAVDGPSDQPLVSGLERAEFIGEVTPGRVGAVLPRDGLERAAVVGPSPPADRIGRHQRLDPVPHRIGDH
ncbi:hypothetical protein RKD26_000025 [Streptomyces calvus]